MSAAWFPQDQETAELFRWLPSGVELRSVLDRVKFDGHTLVLTSSTSEARITVTVGDRATVNFQYLDTLVRDSPTKSPPSTHTSDGSPESTESAAGNEQ